MPVTRAANEALFALEVSGISLRVVDFSAREEISAPFDVKLILASKTEVAFDDVIGEPAMLTIFGDGVDRYIHGMITQFMQVGTRGRFRLYRAQLQPPLSLLALKQNSRIFQNMSTADIVKQVLKEAGISSDRLDFRTQGQYQPREFCVQYCEPDLNFISRLLEEDGVFYFFEHEDDQHTLVFGDSPVCYQPIEGGGSVMLNVSDGRKPTEEYVTSFDRSRQIRSGRVTLKDYNFERPSLDLTAPAKGSSFEELEIYDYLDTYQEEGVGKKLAQVRLEAARVFQETSKGQSGCSRLVPGFTFKLSHPGGDADIPEADFDQEYLLVKVLHAGSSPQVLEEFSGAEKGQDYTNQFVCIPSSVNYRPQRTFNKPTIVGIQTAIVVGPPGEEIHTDKHGRIKIQFHWDREGKSNEKSSCWVRVSQAWTGAGWGALHIPRIGQEVVVSFLDGDPDRPLVTGQVYHGTNTPPYTLPDDKTKSTIKSNSSIGGGGSNEFRFEDKKGSEEIFLHGQKDWNTVIQNNQSSSIGVDQSTTVGTNKTIEVGSNHTEKIGAGMSLTVGASKTEVVSVNSAESVGADKELSVGGAYRVLVGKDKAEKIGGARTEVIGGARTEVIGTKRSVNVGGNSSESIGGKKTVKAGKDYSLEAGAKATVKVKEEYFLEAKKILIQAKEELSIKVGKATIVLKNNGDINIKGKNINVKGKGKINLKASKDIIIKGSKVKAN
jgi:type VI secretion system secreted protein VgrG